VDLATLGGDWQVPLDSEQGMPQGLAQLDKSGDARAFIGVPIANQEIIAQVRADSFGTSSQGAWFGLLARYVDPSNHYYVTVRSTGQIQIRKIVNGVVTVLGSANFTAVPGQYYELRFRVINDQLQLFVDNLLVVSAHDTAITKGQYGLATYRTAATWQTLQVSQP
jgi:pectate lyase